jgi:tetratricopeptide (TPR) repeat protein/predicted aspartyl protease
VQNHRVKIATRKLIALSRPPCAVRVIVFALLSATLVPFAAFAECKRSKVDLPVTIQGTRPVIGAKFNGQEVRLLVDSGAFFSLISSAAVEQFKLRTGMAPFGLVMHGIGGSTVPSLAIVKVFTIANVDVPNVEFLVSGNEVGAGSNSVGLIGQNILERWDVEYDLANGMIRLMKDEDCRKAVLAYWLTPGQSYTAIKIQNPTPRAPLTIGSAYVNGVKIRVTFDTGASLSVLSLAAAERAGIKIDMPGVTDGGLSRGVGRNTVKTYIAPFDSFKFEDGEEIRRTRLRIADINLDSSDMLLGADFFLSHRVFVANSQNKLYFTYNGGPVFNLMRASKPASDSAAANPAADTSSDSASNTADTKQANSDPNKPEGEQIDAAALARRGSGFAGRRDFEHALADLTRASELEPNNAEYVYLRGLVYAQSGDAVKAMTDFNRAIELKSDHVPALMSRAELRIRTRNIAEARTDLDAVNGFAAKQSDVRFGLGFAYQRINAQSMAIEQFDMWIPAHYEDARLASALTGRCRARAVMGQDLALALKDCNAAVSRSTKGSNAGILDTRALLGLRLGDYDKSINDYDAALKIEPQNAGALYGRGIAKIKKKKIDAGEADIAKAEKIAPKVAERFKALGIAP